jgi:ribosomal protein S18 acetylase RimI-like enzyme
MPAFVNWFECGLHDLKGFTLRELHPQWALMPRVSYVALEGETLVGFIAGHLTVRFACDGELEWINVVPEHRGSAVGSELLRLLAAWFAEQKASRVCVDVDPANTTARRFYKRHGADNLNEHWLVWNDIKIVLGSADRTNILSGKRVNCAFGPNIKN